MALRFRYETLDREIQTAIRGIQKPLAKAATKTIKQAALTIKARSKSEMQQAGFSARSSNNLKYVLEPPNKETIDISARFFFRTGYFNVFEQGTVIQGKPLLWLPLPSVPMGARRQLTPREYIARLGPLTLVKNHTPPLLVGAISRTGVVRARQESVRFRKRAFRLGSVRGQNVPLYVGISAARIPKKFNITGIIKDVAGQLPLIYQENAKKE